MRRDSDGTKGKILHALPLILYCVVLFIISGMPQPPTPDLKFDLGDKLIHAGAFFIMALLAYHAARRLFPAARQRSLLLIAVGFASLYGATDEIHQSFVPERSSDILDWVADTAGALMAVPVMLLLRSRLKLPQPPH